MANIEHRDINSVLQAFDFFEKPNFSIYLGREQRCYYDGGNMDEGRNKLEEWLTMIANNGTGAVYTLRVYPENVTDITSKSSPSGSTTFNLSQSPISKDSQGNIIIAGSNQPQYNRPVNDSNIMARLDKLEATNMELLNKLHEAQMNSLKQTFANQIAGLQLQQAEKPDVWERLGETFLEKPERMDRLIDTIGNIADRFLGTKKNFITDQVAPGSNINGTMKKEPQYQEQAQEQEQEQEENILNLELGEDKQLINPMLSEAEKMLKSDKQFELTKERLEASSPDTLDKLQMVCLETLEARIGGPMVTQMLLAVACMDNRDLNKLLNHMA